MNSKFECLNYNKLIIYIYIENKYINNYTMKNLHYYYIYHIFT